MWVDGRLQKGRISAFEKKSLDGKEGAEVRYARIISITDEKGVSPPLTIPQTLLESNNKLKINDLVVFTIFPDYTGIVLAKMG